jgi:voltage-gated sodium channel
VGSAPDLGCAADAAGGLSHRLLDPQHGIGGGRAWPDLLCGGCLATKLFGIHPDPNMQECFGTISASAYTLFQIMTLESWSMDVVRPTMTLFPWAWAFFLPFIIISSFAVLNFFIGIIVDSMQTAQKLEAEALGQDYDAPVTQRDLQKLHA